MAERSSELDKDTMNEIKESSNEFGSPGTFATTAVGEYAGDTSSESRALSSTSDETPVVDPAAEPDEIKAQIEHTRSEMSETINAIQEKLSISHIAEQVKEEVSDQITGAYESAKTAIFGATAGKVGDFMARVNKSINRFSEDYGPTISEAGTTVVNSARSNPVPFALIGVGLSLLLLNNRRKSYKVKSYRYRDNMEDDFDYDTSSRRRGRGMQRRSYAETSGRYNQDSTISSAYNKAGNVAEQAYNRAGDVAGQAYNKAGEVAGQAYEGVSSAASTAYQGVSSAANSAYQGVGSVANTAYEQVGNLGSGARQAARWTQETYERQLEENPFAVGAVAFALGAVIGLTIPSTEVEGEYMGEYRENLIQQAQEAAGGLISKAQQVASEVTQTVKEEVKAQGSASS